MHQISLEVPANTLITNPSRKHTQVNRGIINGVMFEFPLGCKGLVKLRALINESQMWPREGGEWMFFDDFRETFPEHYEIESPNTQITLEAYNEDDTYAHTVKMVFSWVPKEEKVSSVFANLSIAIPINR